MFDFAIDMSVYLAFALRSIFKSCVLFKMPSQSILSLSIGALSEADLAILFNLFTLVVKITKSFLN